jgi:hypothetical protein
VIAALHYCTNLLKLSKIKEAKLHGINIVTARACTCTATPLSLMNSGTAVPVYEPETASVPASGAA